MVARVAWELQLDYKLLALKLYSAHSYTLSVCATVFGCKIGGFLSPLYHKEDDCLQEIPAPFLSPK